MDKVTVVRVWAWSCPECGIVNLGQVVPSFGAEVWCGTGYVNGPFAGCGLGFEIGDIDRLMPARTVRHEVVQLEGVEVRIVE